MLYLVFLILLMNARVCSTWIKIVDVIHPGRANVKKEELRGLLAKVLRDVIIFMLALF